MTNNSWILLVLLVFNLLVSFFRSEIEKKDWIKALKAYISVIVFALIGYLFSNENFFIIYIIIIVFMFLILTRNTIAFIMSYKLAETKVNIHIAIANILQIITVYAVLYQTTYTLLPNSFLIKNAVDSTNQYFNFLYFSTVTFTTVGYGDIVPTHFLSKGLVMSESIVFLVVITIVIVFLGRSFRKNSVSSESEKFDIESWRDRLLKIDKILYYWMKKQKIKDTTPEGCISVLISNGLYDSSRHDALHLRNDLRLLKERHPLPFTIKFITIHQDENKKWHIYKVNPILRYIKQFFSLA